MLLIAGAFFFIVGGAGLFGALCRSQCLLTVYGTLLVLIIVLEIAAGVLAVLYKDQVESYLLTFLMTSIEKYYVGLTYVDGTICVGNDDPSLSNAWDFANGQFK